MYPDDLTLIARGKYSTLGKERRKQLERCQDACREIVTAAQAVLRDSEGMPPVNAGPLKIVETCLADLKNTREQLIQLCDAMIIIKPFAWPE